MLSTMSGWMRWAGIEVNGVINDTMTAAAMLNENRRWYNLNSLAIDYLNESKNEKAMKRLRRQTTVLIRRLTCGDCKADL